MFNRVKKNSLQQVRF